MRSGHRWCSPDLVHASIVTSSSQRCSTSLVLRLVRRRQTTEQRSPTTELHWNSTNNIITAQRGHTRTSSRHSEYTVQHFQFHLNTPSSQTYLQSQCRPPGGGFLRRQMPFYRPQHPRELRAKTNRSFILSCSTRHKEKYDASLEKNVSIVLGCPYYSRWPKCTAWERNDCWL